jgi:hypothetical protein
MSDLDFSAIQIREVPVTGPNGEKYVLRESTGKVTTDHRNAIMASTQFGPNGKVVGLKDLASVEAKFVAGCMWDSKGRNPPVTLIQSWPARVQQALYEKAKELSDMDEESPVRKALELALSREDAPISFEHLSAWAKGLEDSDELRPLIRLFADREAELKNS